MARQGKSSGKQAGGSRGKGGGKSLATANGADRAVESEPVEKRKTSIPEFIRQVRQETSKVTWPTRKETTVTTIMVFIMVIIAAIFFFVVDQIFNFLMGLLF